MLYVCRVGLRSVVESLDITTTSYGLDSANDYRYGSRGGRNKGGDDEGDDVDSGNKKPRDLSRDGSGDQNQPRDKDQPRDSTPDKSKKKG